MSKYEVTQKQWREVMGTNPSYFKGDNLPVEKVSWYDAVEYCNRLSRNEGITPCYSGSGNSIQCDFSANGYRLPTEAEWEYAARGGNNSRGYKYAGSNSVGEVGWYDSNSGRNTHDAGRKKANELELHDMSGNVWEWCWDWKGDYSYSSQTDPRGSSGGSGRVLRGGSWNYYAYSLRVADRNNLPRRLGSSPSVSAL
ncbi:Formylglycine-generating enzyme [subsurface metagenome]